MRLKVRVYASSEQEQPSRFVATVVLTDRREQACWLPEHVAEEAQFFLERVETEHEDVEQRIRSVLQKPFVIVSKASSHVTGAVRTRGDYSAEEPHGTSDYWRAAVGLLKREARLTYDLQDYGRMLEKMEAAVPAAAEPQPAVADRSHILRQCSLYILRKFGDGCWAGKARYDAAQQQWIVPIYSKTLGEKVPIGEITLDAGGKILRAPSRRALKRAVQEHQSPGLQELESARAAFEKALAIYRRLAQSQPQVHLPDLAMALNNLGIVLRELRELESAFAFAPARGAGERGEEPLALPDLPGDPQAIGQEVLADPDTKIAYRYLKLALSDPQMRPTVLAALEAFARAAKKGE